MEADATDSELVERVQRINCEESLNILIKKHSPLCFDIHKKYSAAMSQAGVHPLDVIKDKDYLVYKSALSFKEKKNTKFSTWLGNQMRYYCLNSMNRNKLVSMDQDQIDFFVNRGHIDSLPELKEYSDFVFNILRQLKDKRILEIFQLRYFSSTKGESAWSRIAAKIGVSTQTAINLHDKAAKIIKKKTSEGSTFNPDKV